MERQERESQSERHMFMLPLGGTYSPAAERRDVMGATQYRSSARTIDTGRFQLLCAAQRLECKPRL